MTLQDLTVDYEVRAPRMTEIAALSVPKIRYSRRLHITHPTRMLKLNASIEHFARTP